jgi:hypothetical protein
VSRDEVAGVVLLRASQALTNLRVRLGGSAGRPPALAPGPFLTLVARVPADPVATVCRDAAAALDGVAAYVYPPRTVHLTVLFLDGVEPEEARPAVIAWAAGRPPLRVATRGIGYSRGSAYLALDGGRALYEARRALARSLRSRRRGPAAIRDRVAVANVARFRAPLTAGAAGRLRRISVPRTRLDLGEVELVQTDKLLSDSATRVLARIALRGRG